VTSFDLDLDAASVRERLRDLKDDYADKPVWEIEAGAEYSVYIEYGTRHMPPYPFVRPAVKEFEANPESFLVDKTELSGIDEISSTEEMVRNVALALEKQIKINATAAAGDRSAGTHPDHPKVQTGNLRASVKARRIK